jgi:hypothetical protein
MASRNIGGSRWLLLKFVVIFLVTLAKYQFRSPVMTASGGDNPCHVGQADDYAVYRAETKIRRDAHLRIYPALGNHGFSGMRSSA